MKKLELLKKLYDEVEFYLHNNLNNETWNSVKELERDGDAEYTYNQKGYQQSLKITRQGVETHKNGVKEYLKDKKLTPKQKKSIWRDERFLIPTFIGLTISIIELIIILIMLLKC